MTKKRTKAAVRKQPKAVQRAERNGFDRKAYLTRLKLLREVTSGENQVAFAKRLGIPFKQWNHYERGYAFPKDTAFIIMEKLPGMSAEWLWFGYTGNLSVKYFNRIRKA